MRSDRLAEKTKRAAAFKTDCSSAPARQDRKTFAAASVTCRGRRCRTRQTNQVVSASSGHPSPAPAVYQPVPWEQLFPSSALLYTLTEDLDADNVHVDCRYDDITRNLAISIRSRSALLAVTSVKHDSRMTSDRCNHMCCILDIQTVQPVYSTWNDLQRSLQCHPSSDRLDFLSEIGKVD